MLARQSLGVPGTASFLPFGAMIFPCFFPFMYRHSVWTSVRTKAATSLLLLYRMVKVGWHLNGCQPFSYYLEPFVAPPWLAAVARCATAAKLLAFTWPPFALAVADWMRAAAWLVMGVDLA